MNNLFKDRVNKLMYEHNINQLGLSKELQITQSTLSRNLNGIHRPKAEIVNGLAEFFNVSSDYLLGLSDERNPTSAKEQLSGIQLAFYNQAEELTEAQAKEVLNYIEFVKNRDSKK